MNADATTWTDRKPTDEGLYWWRPCRGDISSIVRLADGGSTILIDGRPFYASQIGGEFAGPIRPPSDDERGGADR